METKIKLLIHKKVNSHLNDLEIMVTKQIYIFSKGGHKIPLKAKKLIQEKNF